MTELSFEEIQIVSGGKPKFINFVFGGVLGAVTGFFVGGPAGAVVGAYTGAAGAGIREAALGLTEITHPEYGTSH